MALAHQWGPGGGPVGPFERGRAWLLIIELRRLAGVRLDDIGGASSSSLRRRASFIAALQGAIVAYFDTHGFALARASPPPGQEESLPFLRR